MFLASSDANWDILSGTGENMKILTSVFSIDLNVLENALMRSPQKSPSQL
jgi:hypothetical protein